MSLIQHASELVSNLLSQPDHPRDSIPVAVVKGAIGVAAATGPVIASRLVTVELWMKLGAIGCGILVSILTGISIGMTIERKIRLRHEEMKQGHIIRTQDPS